MTRLEMRPLTRVEGSGRVELVVNDGQLTDVRVALLEAPRLFEKLLVGHGAAEVADVVCRICAICSAVHKLAALAAIEQALAIEIPPTARLLRELLLLGGHLQSHALHLFCLILPDFSRRESILDLLRAGDPLAAAGLELKAFGNRLQEVAGGRVVHPVTPVLGGVAQRPVAAEVAALRREVAGWRERWPQLAGEFAATARYPAAQPPVGRPLATGIGAEFTLSGAELALSDGRRWPAAAYAALLDEQPLSYSRAKRATGAAGPFLVGALARQQLHAPRGDGAGAAAAGGEGIHANNTAQLVEIGWTLQRAEALLAALDATAAGAELRVPLPRPRAGHGTALYEAPRGLLIHHYLLDDWGQVAVADVVTPTAINQHAMELQLLRDLAGIAASDELCDVAERIVRAFDPCISCAVHRVDAGRPRRATLRQP